MERSINVFKGLNQDIGYDSIEANYVDAKDIRITTTQGESLGSFTNIKGMEQAFTIPQDGSGLKEIIGFCTIRDKIIIFVADNSNTNGWLYKVEYDEDRNILDPTLANSLLYFSDALNFNKEHPIEAFGRYESACIQRAYWTDYENYLRSINVADPNLATLDVGLIDIYPNLEWTQPLIKEIPSGGNLKVGVYQAAFKLITIDGKESLISPPSVLTHIVSDSESGTSNTYNGDPKGASTSKSILISIDTTNYQIFDKITLIISYSDTLNGTPVITEVESTQIGILTEVTFLYTGSEISTIVTYDDFASKNFSFKTCKTLTQKDNSLVIANLKQEKFDIQDLLEDGESFDTRVPRYDRNGDLPNPLVGTPEEIEALKLKNAFNEDYNRDQHSSTDWHLNKQFKYQINGTTLGGEGPNISYKFTLYPTIVDSNADASSISVSSTGSPAVLNDSYTYFNESYPSLASPQLSGVIRGFKRGETYRIGFVGYNLKGEASFVEFIGDIKFPDISETTDTNNESGNKYYPLSLESGNNTIAYQLGLDFTIDFSTATSLLTKIKSYQIVRVERERKDQRRIASGLFRTFYYPTIGEAGPDYNFGSPQVNTLHLANNFNFTRNVGNFSMLESQTDFGTIGADLFGDYFGFYSPEIGFNYNGFKDYVNTLNNASLLIVGAYSNYFNYNDGRYDDIYEEHNTDTLELIGTITDIRKKLPNVIKVNKISPVSPYSGADRGVEYVKQIIDKSFVTYQNQLDNPDIDFNNIAGPFTGGAGPLYMRNFYVDVQVDTDLNNPSNQTQARISKGASGLLGRLEPGVGFRGGNNSGSTLYVFPEGGFGDQRLPILDLILDKSEVYGGFTQNALELNIFIPCSPVIPIGTLTPKVFGGDIFLSMWCFQERATWNDRKFFKTTAPEDNAYFGNETVTINCVIESSVNIELNYGSTLKTGVEYDVYGGPTGEKQPRYRQETNNSVTVYGKTYNMYDYNSAYSKENNNVSFFVNPRTDLAGCDTNDLRTLLSDVKTNEEVIDSWTKFSPLNFWDVDDYGSINKIINYKTNVYFFQDKAVGVYSINPRALVPTNDGIQTELGTAQGIVKHQYISETNGSIHQWAVKATDSGIYYFDGVHKKLFVISQGNNPISQGNTPFSEIKGLHSFIQQLPKAVFVRKENGGDNPILRSGVHISNDKINDEVLITFLASGYYRPILPDTEYFVNEIVFNPATNRYWIVQIAFTSSSEEYEDDLVANSLPYFENKPLDKTLVYDELMQEFSSFYNATPKIYLENGNILMSPDPQNSETIYTHDKGNWGEIYGNIEESYIKLVINPNADLNKVLRFIEYNSIVRDDNKIINRTLTITAFSVETQYQNTGKVLFSQNRIMRKFDKWRIKIPRDQVSTLKQGRLRSTYFLLTLYFDNTANKEIIVNRVMSYYDLQQF
jgi:hypothetical protein